MGIELIITLVCTGLGGFWALLRILIMQRIDNLEKRSQECLSDKEVRLLLHDKLDPMKEDLKEIRDQMNKLLDRLIRE